MMLGYVLAFIMQGIALGILSYGLCLHLFKGSGRSNFVLIYLLVLFAFELLNAFAPETNLFLYGICPFIHFVFYYVLLKNNWKRLTIQELGFGVIFFFVAVILYNSANNETLFQAYSSVFFGSLILLVIVHFFYQVAAGKILPKWRKVRFVYASIAFFSLDVFLSISANYLVNASFVLVVSFWIVRFVFLQLYYLSLIQLNHSSK